MYGDLVIFIFIATFAHLVIGCKKKPKNNGPKSGTSEAAKEKPAAPQITNSGPSSGEIDKNKPPKSNDPKMATRDANDNETINDAKSDWGELPK